jgi:L-alanine-DL-glutamate epimerase-like enolase superfamily enzyme
MFTEDPVSGGMTYHDNGVVKVPDTPGLGAWIGEEYLNKFEKIVL